MFIRIYIFYVNNEISTEYIFLIIEFWNRSEPHTFLFNISFFFQQKNKFKFFLKGRNNNFKNIFENLQSNNLKIH